MPFEKLAAVIDGFGEIDPNSIVKTSQPVLLSRGLKADHTNEAYLYGFARAYLEADGQLAEEIAEAAYLQEGARKTIVVNGYERSSAAKQLCIAAHGSKCWVCSFDFGEAYGDVARGFIHVHHLIPIWTIGKEYLLDPVRDLRPLCPNCHAVVHRRKEAYPLEEVKAAWAEGKRNS